MLSGLPPVCYYLINGNMMKENQNCRSFCLHAVCFLQSVLTFLGLLISLQRLGSTNETAECRCLLSIPYDNKVKWTCNYRCGPTRDIPCGGAWYYAGVYRTAVAVYYGKVLKML